jgi:hypothetical protein
VIALEGRVVQGRPSRPIEVLRHAAIVRPRRTGFNG